MRFRSLFLISVLALPASVATAGVPEYDIPAFCDWKVRDYTDQAQKAKSHGICLAMEDIARDAVEENWARLSETSVDDCTSSRWPEDDPRSNIPAAYSALRFCLRLAVDPDRVREVFENAR